MSLQHYLNVLKRRAVVIILVIAATLLVVIGYNFLSTPVYTARATIRVLLDVGISDFALGRDSTERLLNTYDFVLESNTLIDEALYRLEEQQGLNPRRGLHSISSDIIPASELIRVTVEHENPVVAQDLANLMTTLLAEYAQKLYVGNQKTTLEIIQEQLDQMNGELDEMRNQLTELVRGGASELEVEALRNRISFQNDSYENLLSRYDSARLQESLRANSINVVQPALLPTRPTNALGTQEVGLAFVVGLLGGIGLAFVLENLDTRFHTAWQVEQALHLPVLGLVPYGFLTLGKETREPSLVESYRLLALNLQTQVQTKSLKTILITSAVADEEKSMVTSNLAQLLAEQANTIFLIESDMRRPTIQRRFNLENGYVGLSELLGNMNTLDQAVIPTHQPTLFVIPSGPTPSNPTKLLASTTMTKVLSDINRQAQLTLLDAPPVLGIADVSVLIPRVDAVLLVVDQMVSRREQVRETLKQLEIMQGQVLGIVFLGKKGKTQNY